MPNGYVGGIHNPDIEAHQREELVRLRRMAAAGRDLAISAQWAFDALEALLRDGPPTTEVGLQMYRQSINESRQAIAAYEAASKEASCTDN